MHLLTARTELDHRSPMAVQVALVLCRVQLRVLHNAHTMK